MAGASRTYGPSAARESDSPLRRGRLAPFAQNRAVSLSTPSPIVCPLALELGSLEKAQKIAYHAYRNALLVASKHNVPVLALPILGGDDARGACATPPFARVALAAVQRFAYEGLTEV